MTEKKPFHVSGLEPTKMKVLGVNIFPLVAKVAGLMSDETRKKQMTKKVYLIVCHFFPLYLQVSFVLYTFPQCLKSFLAMSNTLFSRCLTLWLLLRSTFPQYSTLFFIF